MKKLAIVVLSIGIMMMAPGPASAARLEWEPYGPAGLAGICFNSDPPLAPCVSFEVLPGESGVEVWIADDSGHAVYATVSQDYDDDGVADASTGICGSGSFGLRDSVPLGVPEIIVTPQPPPLDSGCGLPTTGIVIAEFT